MAVAIVSLLTSVWTMALVFVLGGIQVAGEETLEDSFCAEVVDQLHHGMPFGAFATVNGIGYFLSSTVVGALWSAFSVQVALGYSAMLYVAGAILMLGVRSRRAVSELGNGDV